MVRARDPVLPPWTSRRQVAKRRGAEPRGSKRGELKEEKRGSVASRCRRAALTCLVRNSLVRFAPTGSLVADHGPTILLLSSPLPSAAFHLRTDRATPRELFDLLPSPFSHPFFPPALLLVFVLVLRRLLLLLPPLFLSLSLSSPLSPLFRRFPRDPERSISPISLVCPASLGRDDHFSTKGMSALFSVANPAGGTIEHDPAIVAAMTTSTSMVQ